MPAIDLFDEEGSVDLGALRAISQYTRDRDILDAFQVGPDHRDCSQ